MRATLTRHFIAGNALIGSLDMPGLSQPLLTLEDLPNHNMPGNSCIPSQDYHCAPHGWGGEPVKIKRVWEVLDVPGRSAILFHAGNTDADTRGCILVGTGVMQGRLVNSQDALTKMRLLIGNNGFDLHVLDRVSS